MAIPSQLPPQLALAIRQGALQLLALQSGQVIEAKVLGTTQNGTTQVQIGQQTLNVALPAAVATGTLLTLLAQGSGSQQKLVLVQPQAAGTVLAQAEGQVATALQAAISLPSNGGPVAAMLAPARPGVLLPVPGTVLPVRAEALQPLALQPGQRVEAQVLGAAPSGATQMQIGRETLDVRLPTPLPAGTVLPLQVQVRGAQATLVVLPPPAQGAAGPQAASGGTPQSLPANTGAITPLPRPAGTSIAPPSIGPTQQTVNTSAAVPVSQSAPQPAPLPNPPQAALVQMVQAAVQRQDSVANLTTVLAAVVDTAALPLPVTQAVRQVLAASLQLGPAVDGAALQKAIVLSGVFQEAMLARGTPELAKGDLKTSLLVLQKTLVSWLGQAAATTTVPPGPLPPPVRGALPRAKPGHTGPVELPDTPIETGKVVLERTESSLARLRLHQHASLPEPAAAGSKADWSMDLPVLIGSYQTVLQLQIHRDEAGPGTSASERGWQIRFAMDLPKLGEVGAQVGLRGGTTSVRLWASDADTAETFEQAAPQLVQSLSAAGLRPGIVIVRAEEPVANPPEAGHFVDALT